MLQPSKYPIAPDKRGGLSAKYKFGAALAALTLALGFGLESCSPANAGPVPSATQTIDDGQTTTETTAPVTVQPPMSEQATTASTSANQDNPNVNMMPTKEEEFRNTILAQGYTPDLDYAIVLRGGSFPNIGVNGSWTSWTGTQGLAAVHGCNSDHTPNDISMSILYKDQGYIGQWTTKVSGSSSSDTHSSDHGGLSACGAQA